MIEVEVEAEKEDYVTLLKNANCVFVNKSTA